MRGDMMIMVKSAGVALGEEAKDYGSHSFRRGGATAYMAAGVPYETVRMFGRWKSDCARSYIDAWAGMMSEAASLVNRGHVAAPVQGRGQARTRDAFDASARSQAERLIGQIRRKKSKLCASLRIIR